MKNIFIVRKDLVINALTLSIIINFNDEKIIYEDINNKDIDDDENINNDENIDDNN